MRDQRVGWDWQAWQDAASPVYAQKRSAPLYRCFGCLQRDSAKAPQKNIAPNTAANQAGGPLSGGLLKMLIAPPQSAAPMPRQVNRRIYFPTIIESPKYTAIS